MRFTLIKDLRQDSMMKPILLGLLSFSLVYLVADILVKYYNFGILPSTVSITLFGSEEVFLDPITKATFLEFWHIEIFFIMMILLSLSAVFIRLCTNNTFNLIILNITLLASIISIVSLVLSYFVSSSFIYPYIFSFYTWHILGFYMGSFSLWNLLRA